MPIVAPARPTPVRGVQDRPPHLSGLLSGMLLAIPLWAVILAFVL
ncbi:MULTISPECIES: hypothetical protein [Sphingomonas]|jgi:hypothetical protein|nr:MULTISPECIES: hypothetical protein [Sphingomonas]WCP70722.1 hypothetical protein PPZ50_10015 [Sphingomonas hankookensis]